ncbi:MAG: hypothetical protein GY754_26775 [bacterium]|nr:hypothetical protein [bacterium]
MKRNNLKKCALLLLILFISTCTIVSCKKSSNKGGKAVPADGVVLEGLYATSVNLGYEEFGPHKLFDGTNDYWATMPGAGQDEGVMLYFEKPVRVESIKVIIPGSGNHSKVNSIGIYANGLDKGSFSITKSLNIKEDLTSLYIRISGLGDYTINKPAAIQELEIYGTGGKKLNILPPAVVTGTVKASSILTPEVAYNTDFLFDSRKEFGWVEGSEKSGTGESLTFSFNDSVTISKIKVWNGYLRSEKHFKSNERVKNFSFGTSGGESAKHTLSDSMDPQVVELAKPLKGKEFVLKIEDIYKGSKYTDCVISELRFFDGARWFVVHSGGTEKRKKALMSKINGTVLEKIIDKRLNQSGGEGISSQSQSLILRSNNSFVLWVESEDSTYDRTMSQRKVLDGNWELVSLSGEAASIKIFGKIFNIAELSQMYQGDKRTETVSIFQDLLTVSKDAITAKKVFNKISL